MASKKKEGGSPESLAVNVLHDLTEKLTGLLTFAKQQAQDSLQAFASTHVCALGASIGFYCDAFLRLGVVTRKAFDDVLGHLYRYEDVQNAMEELDDLESDWNAFLKNTESKLTKDKAQSTLSVGSPGPCDIELKDARTGRPSTIRNYLAKGHVIVVLLRHFA